MTIRPLAPTDSIKDLTSLVRLAYKPLGDRGFRFWGTWQSEDDTRQRCSEGHCLVAVEDERLIGTVTVKQCREDDDPEWYRREGTWVVTQFAVEPCSQGSGLGSRLLTAAEAHAFQTGGDEAAIDTAEGAAHLVAYYAKRGYRHVGSVDWPGTNYVSVVMSKRLRPVLTTPRLVLRELRTSDVAAFQSHWADPRFKERYPPGRMTPDYCREMVVKEAASLAAYPRTNYHWAIEREGEVIGGVRLTPEAGGSATLGYGLGPEHWGRGYASEAVAEVVRYAFEELLLARVQAWVFANNEASKRVLLKQGFVHEGTMRAKVPWGDGRMDDEIYGLLREERRKS